MFKKEYIKFLCCPDCRSSLELKYKKLVCKNCNASYEIIDNIPILLSPSMAKDVKLSLEKWDDEYKKTVKRKELLSLKEGFRKTYLESNMRYIKENFKTLRNKKYLEIGCGPFFIGQELAQMGSFVVGIDYSMNALRLAKFYLEEEKIKNYLLVCGDISKMPFKENTFDLLYGGGVIEHFKDTVGVVKENFRVLKKGGIAFNTVPYLNLGSLTYRQLWGNIPNAPILKEIAEFVHIKLLKSRRMIYGYEYSFTKGQLRKIFKKSGFKSSNVDVDRLQVPLLFEYLKYDFLRSIARAVASGTDLFWPGLYVLAKK
jgi:ubiquinone/menaquinone biosynthesis C-methylase UbiE/uncharacterized protein YbaR (Trm112 family)